MTPNPSGYPIGQITQLTATPIPRIPLATAEDIQPPTDMSDDNMGFIGGAPPSLTSTPVDLEKLQAALAVTPNSAPLPSSTMGASPATTTVITSTPAGSIITAVPVNSPVVYATVTPPLH